MKKVLLLTLLACCTFGARVTAAETTKSYDLYVDTYPWNYTAAVSGKIEVTFDTQWGEFKLTSDNTVDVSEYSGYKIVVSEVSNVQMKMTDSEGDHYPELTVGTNEGSFSTDDGDAVTTFELQGTVAGAYITVDEAYLVKSDGTEERMVYGGPSWGCSFFAHEPATITYTGQYGGTYLVDDETEEPATFTHGNGETQVYTVTMAEALEQDLTVELDNESDGFQWFTLTAGSTEYTFTVDDTNATQDVSYIYIKANGSTGFPFTVHYTSITAVITSADGDDNNQDDQNQDDQNQDDQNQDQEVSDIDLPLDGSSPAGGGFNTSYDTSTHTITLTGDWGGYGWYYSTDADDEAYAGVQVVFTTQTTSYIQLVIIYDDGTENGYSESTSITGSGTGEEQTLYLAFNQEYAGKVKQIYVQGQSTGDEIILISATILVNAPSQEVTDKSLPMESDNDLGSGWSSSYDAATKTITYEDSWAGRGWWYSSTTGGGADDEDYDGILLVFKTESSSAVQVVIEYNADSSDNNSSASVTGSGTGAEQAIYCPLDETMKSDVEQIYIQLGEAGTVTLVSATLIAEHSTIDLQTTTTEGYATYYDGENAYVMPESLQGTAVTGVDGSSLTMNWEYQAGCIVPAGTALLLKGAEGEETQTYSGVTVVSESLYEVKDGPDGNMLYGSDEEGTTTVPDGEDSNYYFYKFSYNNDGAALGFYWDSSAETDGGPFTIAGHRCWLAILKSDFSTDDGGKLSGFALDDGGGTTGISSVTTSAAKSDAVYNLQGMRVSDTSRKGLYIVGGRKVVK